MIPDRNSPLPLWAQVLSDLRVRLARGEFTGRFPGDEELRETYGVSRHTVREAVRRLQAEGIIERGRGRGTFVTGALIEQPLGALYSLFRSVEAQGYVQRSVVRYLEERRDEEAAKVLGRSPDEPLVYLERLRLADDQPIVLDCSWLPAALARPLLKVDFARTALYHELHAQCGLWPDARLGAAAAGAAHRRAAGPARPWGPHPGARHRAAGHQPRHPGRMAARPGARRPVQLRRQVGRGGPRGGLRARRGPVTAGPAGT